MKKLIFLLAVLMGFGLLPACGSGDEPTEEDYFTVRRISTKTEARLGITYDEVAATFSSGDLFYGNSIRAIRKPGENLGSHVVHCYVLKNPDFRIKYGDLNTGMNKSAVMAVFNGDEEVSTWEDGLNLYAEKTIGGTVYTIIVGLNDDGTIHHIYVTDDLTSVPDTP